MTLEKTWRWFGETDPVSLDYLKQMGIEGVVTALHHIPVGSIWRVEEIQKVQTKIESYGMRWSVVESLPVAEGIKTHDKTYPLLIENYKQSIRNLGTCGIDTICYNFMPVLDWARTNLSYKNEEGGESMLFDYPTFAAFDLYILKRKHAELSYPPEILTKALRIAQQLTDEEKEKLAHNIIIVTQAFINGSVDENATDYKTLFLHYLEKYRCIDQHTLRQHLSSFLHEVVPVAEEYNVKMCIHPDDPPFPLLGLPRIASTLTDLLWIIDQYKSRSNGITFCTGSLSARKDNDLIELAEKLAPHIHFAHLRNTRFLADESFYESGHLEGRVDMYALITILLKEQNKRAKEGWLHYRIPFRPDHGIRILDDFQRTTNPGYPLIGRLKGLAEIDGMQTAIARMIKDNLSK